MVFVVTNVYESRRNNSSIASFTCIGTQFLILFFSTPNSNSISYFAEGRESGRWIKAKQVMRRSSACMKVKSSWSWTSTPFLLMMNPFILSLNGFGNCATYLSNCSQCLSMAMWQKNWRKGVSFAILYPSFANASRIFWSQVANRNGCGCFVMIIFPSLLYYSSNLACL